MVWNYHDDDLQNSGEPIDISIAGLPVKKVQLTQYRIDDTHSNSYAVWQKMGSPKSPTTAQIDELENAGQLKTMGKSEMKNTISGSLKVKIVLPRQGVTLLKMTW